MEEAVKNLTLEELRQKVLSLVEITKCAVCLESVRQEVVQCVNGHLICSNCKADLKICPTCRNNFSQSKPSHFVFQVIEILPTRCKYRECRTILRNNDDHEKYCGFKPTQCKWCTWEGKEQDIWKHCLDKHDDGHGDDYYDDDDDQRSRYFNINKKMSVFSRWDTILNFGKPSLFFWEQTINDPATKIFTKTWHLVPIHGKPTGEFFVTLSFNSESGHSTSIRIKLNLDPDAPSEDNSISVPHRLLSHFIDNSVLCYSIVKSVDN